MNHATEYCEADTFFIYKNYSSISFLFKIECILNIRYSVDKAKLALALPNMLKNSAIFTEREFTNLKQPKAYTLHC